MNDIIKTSAGNPYAGKAKDITRDVVWAAVHDVALMLFKLSESELEDYVKKNSEKFPRAVRVLIDNSEDPRVIWAFIERIIGKRDYDVNITNNIITHEDLLQRLIERKNGRAESIDRETRLQEVETTASLQDS